MGLRFDPIGGGQFKQALKSIIEAESQPIKQLQARKAREEARMKLFQEFKTKFGGMDKVLGEFTDFRKFRELKADLGDGNTLMGVTIDKDKAEPGTYTIQIDQLAARTSIISNGFTNPDDPVMGIGFVVAQLGNGETAEIFIDEGNSSLRGIANSINRQPGAPIHASVIQDVTDTERPWKIIMTGKKDGLDDRVQFPEFYFLDGSEDFYIDDTHDAQNAQVSVDGFPIQTAGNDIPDFLQGISAHLKQAKPDQPFTLTITQDYQKISGKMKAMVDQMNGILEFINKQNQVDEKSDTKATFAGDTGLQTIEYRLRNLMHEGFPVGDPESEKFRFAFLNEMGVEFEKSGQLAFKEDKFTKAMEKDFDGVAEAITGPYGIASQLREVIQGYTRTGNGFLSIRETGIRARIQAMDDDIARKEQRLEQRQQSLTEQFARLEGTLGNLQRQSQYLSATLPGGGGGNLVSQLLGG